MSRTALLPLLLLPLALAAGRSAVAAVPSVRGCGQGAAAALAAARPLGKGPLRIEAIDCLKIPHSPFGHSPPRPSPDGGAVFAFDPIRGLWLQPLAAAARNIPGSVSGQPLGAPLPFAWSSDSRALLGVRQKTAVPSGFAMGPLQPFLFGLDGSSRALPPLRSAAGPLDELYWAGGSGLAVAAFGTKGGYYRPEHSDPNPTIAIVDARRGAILQSVALSTLAGLPRDARISTIAARIDGRGRLRALIGLAPNIWLDWRQGQAPRRVQPGFRTWQARFALAPDGGTVLVGRGLSATGVICEHNPNCPPPRPQSGPVAELRDLASGRLIWAIRGRAERFRGDDRPAISPDGRLALVSLPDTGHGTIAGLVSMADGRLIQAFARPWTSECALGFAADGRSIWISGGSRLVRYRVGGR